MKAVKSTKTGSFTPVKITAATKDETSNPQQFGKHITGTYLVDLYSTTIGVTDGEITLMEGFRKAMESTPEKEMRDALRDMPKLAEARKLNKTTFSGYAGKCRAMYRATIVTGSAAWAAGLGRDAAAAKATSILVEHKVMPNGSKRLDKTERAEKRTDDKQDGLILEATRLARKAGENMASIAPDAWGGYLQQAQMNADQAWADKFAGEIVKQFNPQQVSLFQASLAKAAKGVEAEKQAKAA